MQFDIRKAQEQDLTAIMAIANERSLARMEGSASATQNGFLVSSFTLEDYQYYLSSAEYFFVAEAAGNILGFVLAYESQGIQAGETLNTLLKSNIVEPFVLIKQICVSKASGKHGIASRLYRQLFEQARTPRFSAAVVIEPYNDASVLFHERHGFQKLCNIMPPADADGIHRLRGVWFRDLESKELPTLRWTGNDTELEQTLLVEKQHAAIQLYNHEDNLNWTKFGLLISFMMALLAAVDYLLKQNNQNGHIILVFLVIVMGFSINLMFYQKIKSGLKFMMFHKQSVNALDTRLARLNPNLPKLIQNGDQQISGKSVTSFWMEWVPGISMGIWCICSALLIYTRLF